MIGAGLSGLVAAADLASRGLDVVCVEATGRAGGALGTTREDGWLVEHAADAVASDEHDAVELLARLGLATEPARPAARRRWVAHAGQLVPLPADPLALLASPLLSLRGKARLLREPFMPPSDAREESLHAFLVRRFGAEAELGAELAATGVFAGDPRVLSARQAFPTLVRLEADHGSVLRGMRRLRRGARRLLAPRDGMQALVDALAASARPALGEPALRLRGARNGLEIETARRTVEARTAVLAVGAAAGALLDAPWPAPRLAPVTVVALGYPEADVRYDGFGYLAPAAARRFALGAVLESSLFAHRSPEGKALVRALVGGTRDPARAALPDQDLADAVAADLEGLGLVRGRPARTWVVRTPGIPQFEVGHRLDRLAAETEAADRRLAVCGTGLRAVAVGDLVAEARAAAERVAEAL